MLCAFGTFSYHRTGNWGLLKAFGLMVMAGGLWSFVLEPMLIALLLNLKK